MYPIDIVPYEDSLYTRVINLLRLLWAQNTEKYFQWKYTDNPYSNFAGMVALDIDDVVGFRGYMATPWEKDGEQFIIPVACDTVVHPDYRMQGVSVSMGMKAEEVLSDYPAIINFSCGENSLPGYKKLGFKPLHDKALKFHPGSVPDLGAVDTSRVYMIDRPRPMPTTYCYKIRPVRDDKYFSWRLRNDTTFIYEFFCMDEDYILLGVTPDRTSSFIVDYTENDLHTIETIIHYIFKNVNGMLSIHHFGASDGFDSLLNKFGFKQKERVAYWPVVVRPLREDISIDKNDWCLRGICSDIL